MADPGNREASIAPNGASTRRPEIATIGVDRGLRATREIGMIATILLGAMLQMAPLPHEVWKERNRPDMPVLPPCDLGYGATIAHSIKGLPADVVSELTRFFDAAMPMSDAGGPFNGIDIVDGPVPNRRFLRAYQAGRYWVIWYERGGIVSGPRTIALHRNPTRENGASAFRMAPGTAFAGDLCIATKAIVAGVRSASS